MWNRNERFSSTKINTVESCNNMNSYASVKIWRLTINVFVYENLLIMYPSISWVLMHVSHLHCLPCKNTHMYYGCDWDGRIRSIKPSKPEFTIVIFIHYKPRIAVAIHDLQWMKMIWSGLKIKENCHILLNKFLGNFHSKTPSCRKSKSVFRDVKWCFNASWGLKGLKVC